MGKQVGAYASNFTGKVGQVVGRKGENGYVVAAYQPQVFNPKTELQEANRMKFAFMSSTASLFANAGALCYNGVRSSRYARKFIQLNYGDVSATVDGVTNTLKFEDTKLSDGVSGGITCTLRYVEPGGQFGGSIGFSDIIQNNSTPMVDMVGGKLVFVMDVSEDGFVMGKYGFSVFQKAVTQGEAVLGSFDPWNVPILPIGTTRNVAVFFVPKLAVDDNGDYLVQESTSIGTAADKAFFGRSKEVGGGMPYKWGATSYLGMVAVTAGGSQG